jgi:hypothetical protein
LAINFSGYLEKKIATEYSFFKNIFHKMAKNSTQSLSTFFFLAKFRHLDIFLFKMAKSVFKFFSSLQNLTMIKNNQTSLLGSSM